MKSSASNAIKAFLDCKRLKEYLNEIQDVSAQSQAATLCFQKLNELIERYPDISSLSTLQSLTPAVIILLEANGDPRILPVKIRNTLCFVSPKLEPKMIASCTAFELVEPHES